MIASGDKVRDTAASYRWLLDNAGPLPNPVSPEKQDEFDQHMDLVSQSPSNATMICKRVLKGRVPKVEERLLKESFSGYSCYWAVEYAKDVVGGSWLELEITMAQFVGDSLVSLETDQYWDPTGEDIFASYCNVVLRHLRFLERHDTTAFTRFSIMLGLAYL